MRVATSMLLVVNFHYVRPTDSSQQQHGIHALSPRQLESQLTEIGRCCEFISGSDLIAALQKGSSLPDCGCLITFDDGLREHSEFAAPVLERLSIPAVFFVCSAPLCDCTALAVHKLHWLRATRSAYEFLRALRETAAVLGVPIDDSAVDEDAAARQYLYDDAPTRRLKFLLNHVLPFDAFERVIGMMFAREADEASFVSDLYMGRAQLRDLASRHTIGSHSHLHRPLASQSDYELRESLERSRRVLRQVSGQSIDIVSYPYGGPTAVSPRVATAAVAAGYLAGFTMERAVNRLLIDPLRLARLSANDAPGGDKPMIAQGATDGRWSLCAAPKRLVEDAFVASATPGSPPTSRNPPRVNPSR